MLPLTLGLDGTHEERQGPWGIMIADASGHGPAAAVVVAMLHAILHAPRGGSDGACRMPGFPQPAALLTSRGVRVRHRVLRGL